MTGLQLCDCHHLDPLQTSSLTYLMLSFQLLHPACHVQVINGLIEALVSVRRLQR